MNPFQAAVTKNRDKKQLTKTNPVSIVIVKIV